VPEGQQTVDRRAAAGNRLQQMALWATVVVAVSGATTLLIGVRNYNRTAEAQVQLLALGTLQHYLDLAVAHPELASRDKDQPVDAQYGWFAAHALTTAQTLRLLVAQQADWQRSINAIIRQHRTYLRSGAFVCEDFTPEFVRYLRDRVEDLKCAPAPDLR